MMEGDESDYVDFAFQGRRGPFDEQPPDPVSPAFCGDWSSDAASSASPRPCRGVYKPPIYKRDDWNTDFGESLPYRQGHGL